MNEGGEKKLLSSLFWFFIIHQKTEIKMKKKMKMESSSSDKRELWILILYAVAFYSFVIQRSLRLSTGTLPILNLSFLPSFLISLFLSSFFKLNYRLSLPTLRLTLRLALQIHSSLQCINSLFFSFF